MSKIGPHCQRSSTAALAWARVAPCVKGVINLEPLRVAQPGAIKIARYWQDNADWIRESPYDMGQKIVDWLASQRVGPDTPNLYVQSTNEIHQSIGQGLEALLLWHRPFAGFMHDHGYKVAGPGLGVGNPPGTEAEVRDALNLMAEFNWGDSDVWSMNEYWADDPENEYTALRHRMYHSLLGGVHPAIAILECSSDLVEGRGTSGWKLRCSPDQIKAETARYAAKLEEDPYVLAACWFDMGPETNWSQFSGDDLSFDAIYRGLPPRTSWSPSVQPVEDGVNLEEVAAQHQGVYGKVVTFPATTTRPKLRIAFTNEPYGQVIEIDNEANFVPGTA